MGWGGGKGRVPSLSRYRGFGSLHSSARTVSLSASVTVYAPMEPITVNGQPSCIHAPPIPLDSVQVGDPGQPWMP